MDNVIVSREHLRQVISSLESYCGTLAQERVELLPSLRAALEQPAVEPFGLWHQADDPDECEFFLVSESGDVRCDDCIPLYTTPQVPMQDPVAYSTYFEYERLMFSIGNQSFAIDYTPEDEPDMSAGQQAEWMRTQLQHALDKLAAGSRVLQPTLSKDQIREVFMAHGFTVKEGQTDLKQYVYDAAYALLQSQEKS